MQEQDIRSIVFSGFGGDKRYIIEKNILENKWSYELELFLLTLKSIILNQNSGGNVIDYSRFKRELQLWESYRHGGDKTSMAILREDRSNYWKQRDESLLTRLLAIILVNQDKNVSRDEVLKHTLYFTGNPSRVLDAILYNSLLANILSSFNDSNNLIEKTKRDLIEFSIVDDIVDKAYLAVDIKEYGGDYLVDFERERIGLIMKLSSMSSETPTWMELLRGRQEKGSLKYEEFLGPLLGLKSLDYRDEFLDGVSNYIYRLRKGRVAPKKLSFEEKEYIDIFKMKEGSVGDHPLLNRIRLKSIFKRDGFEVRLVETRSGIYRFFKK